MIQAIVNNGGTVLVSLLLIAAVAGIIAKLRKDKKRGGCACGGNCGGNCGGCPMAGSCHKS